MNNNLNLNWSNQISNILDGLGVKDICICPGSRNTPLTLAFTNNPNFRCTSHIDERSAAFFALGISKKNKIPSVVVSTSGTAVANFFPAIIESNLSKNPLVVITADRPAYLTNTGENQTINQQNIFGAHVREFQDLNLPSNNEEWIYNKIISLFNSAIGTSKLPPGPIHINIPFEEPLIQNLPSNKKISINEIHTPKIKWTIDDINIPDLNNSIIVCGEIQEKDFIDDMLKLSEHLNAPILADPTSKIRYLKKHKNIISNYNLFLDIADLNLNTIIRFGRKPTSKLLCNLLDNHKNTLYIDKYPEFNDNTKNTITSDIKYFSKLVIKKTDSINNNINLSSLILLQKNTDSLIEKIDINDYRCEGALINNILNTINTPANIFIGNSMAIREMDDLTNNINKKINIYCNRGASGIDGLVSTALGMSKNSNKSNIAILGDLSFYHDMNGLLSATKMDLNIKFVILNNNGGGIFSKLDIAKLNYDKFEKFWTTPLNLDIKKIADLYNLKYTKIENRNDLKKINEKNTKAEIFDYKINIKESIENKEKILTELDKILKD